MKIKKRFLSLGLIATIVLSSISFSNITLVHAEDGVAINETNFPDATFRSYISTEFDSDRDSKLSNDEISNVKRIVLNGRAISDLKGVEYFTALTSLDCSKNNLTSLDVSKNTALTWLTCSSNNLTSLDVSKNTALRVLNCESNNLTSLDVSNNTALRGLFCESNNLTSLDVSKNTALEVLYCADNYFSKVDVTGLNSLRYTDGTIDGTTLFVEAKSSTQDTSTATVSSISASDVKLAKGKTKNISAKVSMSDGSKYTGTVTYKSANTKIAKVDKNGKVKGVAGGKTMITVSAGGKSKKITVKVADIALESTNFALQKGKSTEVEATLTNDSIKSVKSSKTSIAKVSFKKM